MGPPPSTSSAPRRRSTFLIGPRRRGDKAQPPRSPKYTPVSPPPCGIAVLRRSGRNRPRIHGLPSGTSPSAPRRWRRSPASSKPALRKPIEAWEEWGREKAASGARKEECVLPFLRKGAPSKVPTFTTLRFSITSCFFLGFMCEVDFGRLWRFCAELPRKLVF
jgi:hypothetical protein